MQHYLDLICQIEYHRQAELDTEYISGDKQLEKRHWPSSDIDACEPLQVFDDKVPAQSIPTSARAFDALEGDAAMFWCLRQQSLSQISISSLLLLGPHYSINAGNCYASRNAANIRSIFFCVAIALKNS